MHAAASCAAPRQKICANLRQCLAVGALTVPFLVCLACLLPRGRLNVLANVLRKPMPQIFKEFQVRSGRRGKENMHPFLCSGKLARKHVWHSIAQFHVRKHDTTSTQLLPHVTLGGRNLT